MTNMFVLSYIVLSTVQYFPVKVQSLRVSSHPRMAPRIYYISEYIMDRHPEY